MQAGSMEPEHDHALRYLSHHDHRYLRFFKGHTDTVTSLSLSPKSDAFVSTSLVRASATCHAASWSLQAELPDTQKRASDAMCSKTLVSLT